MEAVARENYKRIAPGWAGILACTIGRAKKVVLSESHGIALVAYLGQITNMGRTARENYKRSAPDRAGILAYAIGCVKVVAIL